MKKLLIVVDYQNDFVDGSLGFPGAELLDERIAAKIQEYREAGDEVCFTRDAHGHDYLNTQEGRGLPIPHCIEGTPGIEFYGHVGDLVRESDEVFSKSTFGSKELFEWLSSRQRAADEADEADEASEAGGVRALPLESIELVGLVSNICVLSNAVLAKTACPEVPVIVDAVCTASADASINEKALDILEGLQVVVINRS